MTQQINDLRAQNADAGWAPPGENMNTLEQLPPEAMDPQQAAPRSRGTSKATLDSLPRITVEAKSSIIHEAIVRVSSENGNLLKLKAILGEFGPQPPHSIKDSNLIVSNPRTGKGGLSESTKSSMKGKGSSILYLERGEVTFVKKALLGQSAGARAIIIGNNTNAAWPYVMKDSKGEAKFQGLRIPVVMVKQSDGQALAKMCSKACVKCDLDIKPISKDCIICVETFAVGQKILQLPECNHMFHEKCALMWLTKHNACPYCRRELPTDDSDYEAERRRTHRTHAGSAVTTARHDFYG